MAVASSSTLLTVVNKVLIASSERELSATAGNLLGSKVKLAVELALNDLSLYDWPWLQKRINATSWSTDTATLATNVRNVKEVLWDTSVGSFTNKIVVPYVDDIDYEHYDLEASTGATPLRWTFSKDSGPNVVRVNPYPSTVALQARCYFTVAQTLSIPAADATTFAIPEQFIPLLIKGATAYFHQMQTENPNLVNIWKQELQEESYTRTAKQSTVHPKYYTMYRGQR